MTYEACLVIIRAPVAAGLGFTPGNCAQLLFTNHVETPVVAPAPPPATPKPDGERG